ncbi:glycosyltransferase family 2 protein [Serpentinicella alkaliphila]|nr:glycosyltransferase [Serpentinicella alkaliphila]QUH25812.1 glycosyltransferase family 2 protein [Serpentinicella alkaliphila]
MVTDGKIIESDRLERKGIYIKVWIKFLIAHFGALLWVGVSIVLSLRWVGELGTIVSVPFAIIIITGIAYIPGYINAFTVMSLLSDKQPKFVTVSPEEDITIIIACRNEENAIGETLGYIAKQDYEGEIKVIVVDNASTDGTYEESKRAGENLKLNITVINENIPGKYNALNRALKYVDTEFVATLDADTLLHKSSVRYIVSRMISAPSDVCAVAGSVLVRNSRTSFIAKLQEWDYFLGIASIKRMQGLYQGTLVAQGAFSLYKTEVLKYVGGWPDAIGEDIVLTWKFFENKWRVFYEPLAVAFTDVPISLKHLARQRSRWARGMIEALKAVKPWKQPLGYIKYLTSINLIMPYLDIIYTFVLIPGLIIALYGKYHIVGPVTIFVLPLSMIQNFVLYRYQQYVFKNLGLSIRKNRFGFIVYVLFYQMLMSPISILGYMQEVFFLKRVWK